MNKKQLQDKAVKEEWSNKIEMYDKGIYPEEWLVEQIFYKLEDSFNKGVEEAIAIVRKYQDGYSGKELVEILEVELKDK